MQQCLTHLIDATFVPFLPAVFQHLQFCSSSLLCLSQTNVQNISKDSLKVPIAERVYKRVESGVDVT